MSLSEHYMCWYVLCGAIECTFQSIFILRAHEQDHGYPLAAVDERVFWMRDGVTGSL